MGREREKQGCGIGEGPGGEVASRGLWRDARAVTCGDRKGLPAKEA